jgi:hypothetical protein
LYRWETRFIDPKTGRSWADGYKIKTFLSTPPALDSVYLEYSLGPPLPSLEMFFTFRFVVGTSAPKRVLEHDESEVTLRKFEAAARRRMETIEAAGETEWNP